MCDVGVDAGLVGGYALYVGDAEYHYGAGNGDYDYVGGRRL